MTDANAIIIASLMPSIVSAGCAAYAHIVARRAHQQLRNMEIAVDGVLAAKVVVEKEVSRLQGFASGVASQVAGGGQPPPASSTPE
jgi:hypothetical protein